MSLQLVHLIAAACPDPTTYMKFGQAAVDDKGVQCASGAGSVLNSGDTAWLLASASLVLADDTRRWRSSTAAWSGSSTCSRC